MKTLNCLKFLLIAVCLGLIAGIFFSLELWFPMARTFPRVPIFIGLPENTVLIVERTLTVILVISLILMTVSFCPKIFSIVAVSSLILLISFDQIRLQPWVYQYLLLLTVLALPTNDENSDQTLSLSQIIIAGLYFWSGVQKLNFTFLHETLPMLLTPLQNLLPSFQLPLVWLGIGIASAESLIGCGLVFRRTRKLAVWFAVAMHGFILALLIAKNYNSIVWIWNAALMLIVVIAFWKNDNSIKEAVTFSKANNWKVRLAKTISLASVLLPILSFIGWWDMYLSGALYSGNVEIGVIRINDNLYKKLPPNAQKSVFRTESGGEQMLPFFEWSIAELNVPVYPELRVFKQVAGDICRLTNYKSEIEMIVKEHPEIFNGNYKVRRISCAELER